MKYIVVLSVLPNTLCLSHLQNSSSLKELQRLLYGVVKPMVASSGQISSDQTYSYHQPPGEQRGGGSHYIAKDLPDDVIRETEICVSLNKEFSNKSAISHSLFVCICRAKINIKLKEY